MKEGLKKQNAGAWFAPAAFFCFFALYAVTAQRGVSWQDSGEYQYRVLAGDFQWHSGIARAHPLYILLARAFAANFPDPAHFYAVNLFSGLGLALSLAVLAHNVVLVTRSVWAAVLAVVLLGFAHMAWWLGTVAEVYTWSLAFLMIEVLCLIRYAEKRDGRWLAVLFGVNGLHVGIHNAALLGLPVYVFLLASEMRRQKGLCAGIVCGSVALWVAGGGLILGQAVRVLRETGAPVQVVKSVLFGEGYERYILGAGGGGLRLWMANMALAGISFLNPCWFFAGRGFLAGKILARRAGMGGGGAPTLNAQRSTLNAQVTGKGQKDVLNWLRVLTVLHVLFWVRYCVPDQATFILPALGLLALWAGVGAGRSPLFQFREGAFVESTLSRKITPNGQTARRLILVMLGGACAVSGPWLLNVAVRRTGMDVARSRALPFRDEASYWLLPWKQGEDSAARFVAAVGKQLTRDDVLFADATAASPLMAARQAGALKGEWRLLTPWSGEAKEEWRALVRDEARRVYVVSPVAGYVPGMLLEEAKGFVRDGVLYKVNKP